MKANTDILRAIFREMMDFHAAVSLVADAASDSGGKKHEIKANIYPFNQEMYRQFRDLVDGEICVAVPVGNLTDVSFDYDDDTAKAFILIEDLDSVIHKTVRQMFPGVYSDVLNYFEWAMQYMSENIDSTPFSTMFDDLVDMLEKSVGTRVQKECVGHEDEFVNALMIHLHNYIVESLMD